MFSLDYSFLYTKSTKNIGLKHQRTKLRPLKPIQITIFKPVNDENNRVIQ